MANVGAPLCLTLCKAETIGVPVGVVAVRVKAYFLWSSGLLTAPSTRARVFRFVSATPAVPCREAGSIWQGLWLAAFAAKTRRLTTINALQKENEGCRQTLFEGRVPVRPKTEAEN